MTDNFDKYKILLKELSREANQAVWTSGSRLIIIILILLIGSTITARIFVPFANTLVMFFIFLVEIIALLIFVLVCHTKRIFICATGALSWNRVIRVYPRLTRNGNKDSKTLHLTLNLYE